MARTGRPTLVACALGVMALALPVLALAAADAHGEGAHHAFDWGRFGLQMLNFSVLLFILIKFGGGAINKALRARHDQLKADLVESQRLRAEAETRLAEQERRLINLESEVDNLHKRMKQEAEAEKNRMIKAAEEKARRVQDETRFLLDQQVKQAELNFRAEVAAAAARIAEELVRKSVGGPDQQRLVDSFVGDIENPDAGARNAQDLHQG